MAKGMDVAVFVQEYPTTEPSERLHIELLLKSIIKFFTNDIRQLQRIIPIIQRTSSVSLRLLDWFIVSYAKEHDVTYIWNGKPFNVFNNYRQQLQLYSKKYFDAFRRHSRTFITLENVSRPAGTELIETTLGQLCFFRWCLENGLIEYVSQNANIITGHMKESIKHLSSSDETLVSGGGLSDNDTVSTAHDMSSMGSTGSVKKRRHKSASKPEDPKRSLSATRYIASDYVLSFN